MLILYIPEQRTSLIAFLVISIMFVVFISYSNERILRKIKNDLEEVSKEVMEKFNYIKELYELKLEVEMLKRKGKKGSVGRFNGAFESISCSNLDGCYIFDD